MAAQAGRLWQGFGRTQAGHKEVSGSWHTRMHLGLSIVNVMLESTSSAGTAWGARPMLPQQASSGRAAHASSPPGQTAAAAPSLWPGSARRCSASRAGQQQHGSAAGLGAGAGAAGGPPPDAASHRCFKYKQKKWCIMFSFWSPAWNPIPAFSSRPRPPLTQTPRTPPRSRRGSWPAGRRRLSGAA